MPDLLKTAGAAAASAAQGPDQMNHFLVIVVLDLHVKGPGWPAAVPIAAVGVLLGTEDLLAHAVLDLILVFGLKTNDSC